MKRTPAEKNAARVKRLLRKYSVAEIAALCGVKDKGLVYRWRDAECAPQMRFDRALKALESKA
jgi:transposase-like protein